MGFIASLLGYILNFIYNFVQNYGWAIIIFSVLLRLILLPLTIKQQKTMKKTAKIQEKLKTLQVKYKNDPEKLNRETMDLYKREKISPFSGCLSSILQLVLFLSVFYLVSRPLTYMKNLDKVMYTGEQTVVQNTINDENVAEMVNEVLEGSSVESESEVKEGNSVEIENESTEENSENKEENVSIIEHYENQIKRENNGQRSNYVEIEIINKYRDKDERVNINMNFLGLDLSKIPMNNLKDSTVFIIPLLYIITTFINMKISTALTQSNNKKKKDIEKKVSKDGEETTEEQLESMQQMTNSMNYMMPIMSVAIAIIAPLGLSLYWFISNSLQLIERIVISKVFKDKEEANKEENK